MTALRIISCALLSLLAADLHAEETSNEDLPGLWGLRFVAFGQSFPAYPSSSSQNLTVLPIPYPVYRGKLLRFGEDLDTIANSQLVNKNRVKLSLGLSASFPEESDKLSGRAGMPDLDLLLEAGPELKFTLSGSPDDEREFLLALQLRGAVSMDGFDATGRGFVFKPELEYLHRHFIDSKTELRLRVAPTWATSDYANFFYGVDPAFATPDRPAFDAASGYLNTEFLVGLNRQISSRLEFRGSVRLWANKGSVNDASPLYQRDYDRGIRLALFWTVWESKQRTNARN